MLKRVEERQFEKQLATAIMNVDDSHIAELRGRSEPVYQSLALCHFTAFIKAKTRLRRNRRYRNAAIAAILVVLFGIALYQIPAVRAAIRSLFVQETPEAYILHTNEWKRVYDDYLLTTLAYDDKLTYQDGSYVIQKPDTPVIYFRQIEYLPSFSVPPEERMTVQGSTVYVTAAGRDNYLYWEYTDGTCYELRSECDVEILMHLANGLIYELPPTAPPYEVHTEEAEQWGVERK